MIDLVQYHERGWWHKLGMCAQHMSISKPLFHKRRFNKQSLCAVAISICTIFAKCTIGYCPKYFRNVFEMNTTEDIYCLPPLAEAVDKRALLLFFKSSLPFFCILSLRTLKEQQQCSLVLSCQLPPHRAEGSKNWCLWPNLGIWISTGWQGKVCLVLGCSRIGVPRFTATQLTTT